MKISFNTFVFSSFPRFLPTYSLDETIRFLAATGYDAVEIGCCAPHAWPRHLSKERRREIRETAEGSGIAVSGVLPAIGGGFGCNPSSALLAERQATTEHYLEIIDLASDLNAGMVNYIAGWCAEGMDKHECWEHSLACLLRIASHAADRGVMIAIEPTTADTNLIDTAADARRLMVQADMANVKLMFDTCHVAADNNDLRSYVDDMGADLVNVHAADSGRVAIGDGDVAWGGLFDALSAAAYQGFLTVESGFGTPVDPKVVAVRSLDFIKKVAAKSSDDSTAHNGRASTMV